MTGDPEFPIPPPGAPEEPARPADTSDTAAVPLAGGQVATPGAVLGPAADLAAGEAALPGDGQVVEPDEAALRLAEALVFASATPVSARVLSQLLPTDMDADAVIEALRARYAGRGVEFVQAGGGLQFRTAADLAPRLRKVVEAPRRLPRVAMETLAIVAYHQPVTRPEIEEIRGASLSQQTLDALLEANLVTPKGRRESPGRPTLWGTTPQFLAQFGLKDLRDLPRRDDLLVEPPKPASHSAGAIEGDQVAADVGQDAGEAASAPRGDDEGAGEITV